MPIQYLQDHAIFHLSNQYFSYVIAVEQKAFLVHRYFGKALGELHDDFAYPEIDRSSFSPNPSGISGSTFSLNVVLQEFPGYDSGDYREGICEFTYPDGTKATNLVYQGYEICSGKRPLQGLPATYVEAETEADTLEITLIDHQRGIKAILSYTVYAQRAVLTKSVQYSNLNDYPVVLDKAFSGCLDFYDSDYQMIHLPGAWGREKQYQRHPLVNGIHVVDSKRGASGVMQQPFMALVRPETTEFSGEAVAFHLVYSGNFSLQAEVDAFQQLRVLAGISSFNFQWQLEPQAVFQTPEVVIVYTDQGLNELSHTFHKLYRERLCRGKYREAQRPILVNNWETTYFDFEEEQLVGLAKEAKALGAELFVLDDGWFGQRDSDKTSLGDWTENHRKFPKGLRHFAQRVKNLELKFGLWLEPEMVSQDSDLFRAHPDWHIQVAGRPSSLGRNQLVLDLSKPAVREHLCQKVAELLKKVPIDYIKWDMNRNLTEVGSLGQVAIRQQETAHRYMLGLYAMLEQLTSRFPDVLFENCSGGGGRFDAGMCYYMPQSWASDNTDAIERLKIQYGTSLIFPPIMMCAHLSESPNHQVGRLTDSNVRAAMAMSANFGLMLNLDNKTAAEKKCLAEYIAWYQKQRVLIQTGRFYRIQNPFETNFGSWLFVDENQTKALFFYVQIMNQASNPLNKVRLTGLNETFVYQVGQRQLSGRELMNFGLFMNQDLFGDFQAKIVEINKI